MSKILYRSLSNGLRVYAKKMDSVKSVSIGVFLGVGTRNEVGFSSGISHFIEHMLFKGTKNRSSSDISRDIDFFGGYINAFTDHDRTCYHVRMPYNNYETGIEVLSDMLINSLFLNEEIEKERTVIADEIKMYEDSPEDYIYEKLMMKTFSNRGIGRNVLGSIESISKITRDEILRYFSTHYLPENAVVVVCGNFDEEKIMDCVEKYFSRWDRKEVDKRVELHTFTPEIFVENRDDEQANICIIFDCIGDENPKDYYAVKLISNIFGSSPSSRLFQRIREKEGLCYSVYTAENFYYGCAEFGVYSSCSNENVKKVKDMIIEEIERIKKFKITEKELEFSKSQMKGIVLMSIESTEDMMLYIGDYKLKDEKIRTVEETIDIIDSIDLEYINEIVNKIFTQKRSIGITGRDVEKIWR